MTNLHKFISSVCLLAHILVAGSNARAANVETKPLSKTKLGLNWKAEPQFGGFYAAQDSGYFKTQGLDVEIQQGGSGTPTIQMVAAGQLDFAIVSADEVVISNERGGHVVALFAAYQTNPQAIMTRKSRGFKTLEQVFQNEGTLAWQKGLPYAMFLSKKFKNVKVKTVPYSGGIAPMLTNPVYSQQCFATSEPLTANKAGLDVQTFLVADEGYNPYTTVLVTREDYLQKNPAIVKSFVAAVRSGWRAYLDHPEATNEKMGQLNKSMDAATFKESSAAQKPLIETADTKKNGLGHMTEERWTQLSHQMVDLEVVKKAPPTSVLYKNL